MLYSWLHLLWAALISQTVVLPTLLFFVVLFLLLIPCCNVTARSQVNALIDKADALGSSGNYIQAIQYYDKALAIDPNNVAALINKGNSLNSLGNYADAIQYYDRALTLNPNSFNKVTALSDKGAALNGLGKYSQAITYIDEALAIDPNNVNALINKGNSFGDLGNYAQAIQYYNDALNVDPNNALASTNKGHVIDLLEKQQQNSNQEPASSIGATATQPTTVGCGPGTDNSTCSSSTASEQSSSSQVPSTTTSDNSPIIIPYSSNYYYKVVPAQAEQDFQNIAFNNLPPPGFSEGTAAFGTAYDGCPMYGQKKATDWQINTDILLLKKFVLPASNPMVADLSVVVDNDVQVFINGVDISGGLVTHENCASYDDPFVFHVPEGVLKAGGNILAVRGHDRGIADFLDVQLVGAQTEAQTTICNINHNDPIRTAYIVEPASTDPLCNPVAVPSVDRSAVNEGDTVTLDGSKSTDSGNGNHLLYHWEQVPTGGPTVELSNPDIATPYFTAPKGLADTTKLTFKLVVTDNLDVNDKAYHGNPASTPENVDVTICAPKKDPLLSSGVLNVPVSDPKTGTCDYSQVDVRDTYLGSRYNPVSLAERHLFIIYTDEDGKQTVFRGGPSKDCHPDCGDLVSTITGDYPTGDTDWDPHASSRTVLKGVAAHDADKCFSTVSNSIDEKGIPYKALGPNSNTFAKTLLSKCGPWPPSAFSYGASSLLPPYIQFGSMQVPGWGMPDLVKCYYSKTDDKCG